MHGETHPLPRVRARRAATELAVLALFVLLSVTITWPLARNMDRAVSDPGDPYINTFILAWVHHALTNSPGDIAHPPVFHPHRYALAFSENLFGIALPSLPLSWAGLDPLLIYNIALLAGFVFSAWGAYVMARTMTDSLIAAIGAGVFFAFLPWRWIHLSHLQHQWSGWLPLIVASLIHYWRRPSFSRAAIVAFCFAANGATNLHWLAFSLVAAPAVAIVAGSTSIQRRSWRAWAGIVAAFVAAGLALLPLLLPYVKARQLYGARSSSEDAATWSALPADWLAVAPGSIYSRVREITVFEPERWLFPGVLPSFLAIAALLFLMSSRTRRERLPFYALGAVLFIIGFVGSLGTNAFFHTALADSLSVFEGIRAPARWAMIGYLGMAVLIALGLEAIARFRVWRQVLAVTVISLMVAELNRAPIRYWLASAEPDAVTVRARELRDDLVIAYLPLDQRRQYHLMREASRHLAPMINGVSGFAPPAFRQLESLYASSSLGPSFTDALLKLGVTAVVVSPDALGEQSDAVRQWAAREISAGRLRPLAAFPSELHSGDFAFALQSNRGTSGDIIPEEIHAWLIEQPVRPSSFVFGYIDEPAPDASVEGDLRISGWALAREPITRITIHLENGARGIEAVRRPHDAILQRFPGFEHEPLPAFSFTLPFSERVLEQTDVEVEVTTQSGRVERFGFRWFDWRPAK